MSPLQALAQLSPLPDSVVVTITSPPSGSRVGGAVTVAASVSGAESSGVAGVQFKLDGASLGAEDTTAPYSVSWNTTAASEGWHTLTAVARDANGAQFSSDPVTITVSNTPPPPAPATRYEETDASVTFSVGWIQDSAWPWSGGTTASSRTPGAQATFNFTGTSVTWIGYRSADSGIARVFMDGVFVSDVDLFSRTGELRVPVFTMTGLTNSRHTLTIQVTGMKNEDSLGTGNMDNQVMVDAFDVPGAPVSRLQDTDPFITYTADWAREEATKSWSGRFATVSTTPGAQATLTFNGTAISWIGYRGPDTGTARVYLDGSFAGEVDTYAPTQRVQDTVFTATGLADASHTLTIEPTGLKNDASTGTLIVVDAFDVTTLGARFEETDWSVTYAGNWLANHNKAWSEGIMAESQTPGARATFTFTGTSVSWIGARGPPTGIARVYLDGIFIADVDTYTPTEGLQNTVFTATGLADASHALTIEVTGQKNAASTNVWIVVDAFDVRRPTQMSAPPATPSTPFSGTPIAVPGSFEAENFDLGGEGIAYHDKVPGNAGGQYRLAEDVDIIISSDPEGGGYVVNNFETGEWLAYTINVATDTRYDIEIRTASAFSNGAFHIEIDDVNVTGTITVPNTGSWSSFQWVGKRGVALAAGQHVLRIVADQQYFNLNSIRVLPTTTRSEESAAAYTGRWTSYGPETGTFSGGTILASNAAGATATFTFTGTAVSWIGVRCNVCGIATVSIDGGAPTTVNTAGPAAPGSLTSEPLFTASGLAAGVNHTMVITVTGTTTTGDAHIAVDAFDMTR